MRPLVMYDQATCTLRRLSNSSKDIGSNDCPVQIQQQHKKSAKVAISNYFRTVHVPIADARQSKSVCSVTTAVGHGPWVDLPLPGVTITGPPRLQRLGQATAAATRPVGLPGQRGNSRPKAYQN